MNILLIGSGGREHALAQQILHSAKVKRLYIAPGNLGTDQLGINVSLDVSNSEKILSFCRQMGIDFVVVGPEAPLVEGLIDRLLAEGISAFGPTAAAARLEGSKGFAKDFCQRWGIPTARYRRFTDLHQAKEYVATQPLPIVIKADGLAAGKGVIIADNLEEAYQALNLFLTSFPRADSQRNKVAPEIVIEEFLTGEELSFFVLCDGKEAKYFGSAQDHKRLLEGDKGPNTGGMGAYTPVTWLTGAQEADIMRRIIEPTLQGMATENAPFKGILFVGLMMTKDGPYVIEYNVRFGDPECQVLMMRLEEDFLDLMQACVEGGLEKRSVRLSPKTALTLVMAEKHYPYPLPTTLERDPAEITGLEEASNFPDVKIFHAGTERIENKIFPKTGRVLNVAALGNNLAEARARAYQAAAAIGCSNLIYRKDIGITREI